MIEQPDRRSIRARATSTRCSSGAASTSSRARSSSRPRRPIGAITAIGRELRVLRARALQARLDLLQAGPPRGGAATSTSRCSTTRSRPDTTSTRRATRTPSAGSRTPSASSACRFSNLGGPQAIRQYFAANGHRGYEDRIYSHLGEFYLEKLRFQDAAASYQAFIELQPAAQDGAALQHARDRDLREGRLPEARARVEEGVRRHLRARSPSTGGTSTSRSRPRCAAT